MYKEYMIWRSAGSTWTDRVQGVHTYTHYREHTLIQSTGSSNLHIVHRVHTWTDYREYMIRQSTGRTHIHRILGVHADKEYREHTLEQSRVQEVHTYTDSRPDSWCPCIWWSGRRYSCYKMSATSGSATDRGDSHDTRSLRRHGTGPAECSCLQNNTHL